MKKIASLLMLIIWIMFISTPVNAEIISDTTGPTVTDASCDKQGQTLKPGDTVKFSFSASDPSGLKPGISVNFFQATAYVGDVRLSSWTYNSSTNKYEATCTVPETAKDGEYYISTIYVYDIYDNQTSYSTNIGFKVKGNISDTVGPTVTDASCDKQGQTLKPGDTVKFSFSASDPSGLKPGISVNFFQATAYVGNVRLSSWTYNSSTNKYEATCTIPETAKDGEYYISTIYVYDIYDNQTSYSTHIGFKVKGNISDTTGPTVTDASCDKQDQTLKPGDTVKFSFSASDPSGLKPGISVNFFQATAYVGDLQLSPWTYNSSTDKYEATCTIPEIAKKGEYYISTIYVYDIYDNQTSYPAHLGFYIGMEKPKNTTTQSSSIETTTSSRAKTTASSRIETTTFSSTETAKSSSVETTKLSNTESTEPSNTFPIIAMSLVSAVAIVGVGTFITIRKKRHKA